MASYHVRRAFAPLSGGKSNLFFHQARTYASSPRRDLDSGPKLSSNVENHDIVIVGGGVVGLALANAFGSSRALRQAGHRISVLEASDLSKVKNWNPLPNQWSSRVAAITNESLKFLSKIGAYQYLDESRTCPVQRMQMWDGVSDSRILFDSLDGKAVSSEDSDTPPMARFIENIHLQKALVQNLPNFSNVDVYDSVKVSNISADDSNCPLINLDDGRSFRTRLLVGADGFNSPVKSFAKIASTGQNYDTQCVVGILELENRQHNCAVWQRLLTAGPLGVLPLSDQHACLNWSVAPHIAAGLLALDSRTFASVLNACLQLPNQAVNQLLKKIGSHSQSEPIDPASIQSMVDELHSSSPHPTKLFPIDGLPPKVLKARREAAAIFPLRNFHADQYLGVPDGSTHGSAKTTTEPARTVIVGDAAHVLHPMAGQGLNMGLGDVKELANTVLKAIDNGQDIGSSAALQSYARSRYVANYFTMNAVDQLYQAYSLDSPPVVTARSTAMEVLNGLPSIKAFMMATAGGPTQGSPFTSASEMWSNVADVYEGVQKAKVLAQGFGSIVAGAAMSKMGRVDSSK